MKNHVILMTSIAFVSLLGACNQDSPDASDVTDSSDALSVVKGCGAKARTCADAAKTAADRQACWEELRA